MELKFTKMQGAGNDYIYVDCTEREIKNPGKVSEILSDRHFGIGGDGLVLICKSEVADAKMRMFNLDASEGKMCGNAVRCVGKYLYEKKNIKKDAVSIETLSGIKYLKLHIEGDTVAGATVNMGKAVFEAPLIPVISDTKEVVDKKITVDGNDYRITCVSMGNPHAVIFGEDPDNIDVETIGRAFEYNSAFPERVNTEFIQVINENTLEMRVWERGSGETLACGTGSCAAAAAAVKNGICKKDTDIKIILRGGELVIRVTDEGIMMTGPCETVFEGSMEMEDELL